ncbi:HAD-IIIA family hydrolase [Bosea sp. BH3]|uniref:HAD-IIIA family hydrolase n=1 Tax=Bosea sp. BH3 TaxID=2871701 RepID=UPI0021CAE640|nr:HAD-IIIA family hydrolase [Bosea sp. BH3]MCU4181159.1 HAD-IIIA family hydrolase [Bosea sp. BH3]
MQAVILAGGKGTRLAERLQGRPKPLVDVDGIPLLERQIRTLKTFGVDEIIVLINHAADQIERYCREQANFGLSRLRLIDDGAPRGTAGAVLACLDVLAPRFLIVYGDTLFNIDIGRFVEEHARSGADATLFLHPNDHPHDSDLVSLGDGDFVSAFHSKPHPPGTYLPNLVNAAFYVMERSALEPWREVQTPCDFGADLFPMMLSAGARLKGYNSFEYIKDLGTPTRLDKAVRHLRTGVVARATLAKPQTCVFLDRDGTLNVLRDYVRKADDLVMLPGAAEAVKRFNDAEHRIAIVTNQPVIARGECSFEGLRTIHAKLDMALSEAGGFADRLYFCPHHPDAGFPGEVPSLKIRCDCRKPEPGMIRQAAADLNADLDRSWMVGDSTSDLMAAKRAGVRSILVRTGEGGRDGKYAVAPDFVVDDIAAAASFILDVYPSLTRQVSDLVSTIAAGDLILLGGAARAGKSTLSRVLADGLRSRGIACEVLSLDRWIHPEPDRKPGVLGRFDLDAMQQGLRPWLDGAGGKIPLPFYDRVRRRRLPDADLSLALDTVLILEGVPALLLSLDTKRPVHRAHVATDEAGRKARVIADLVQRGLASSADAETTYAARAADETALVQQAAPRATFVFDLDASFSDPERPSLS